MKIGILGSGVVAQTLGSGFARRGHDVVLGSRTPNSEKLKSWKADVGKKGRAGTFADAAAHGEVLVLAALGSAIPAILDRADRRNFAGKVVIDVTNPLDFSKGTPPGVFVGTTDSLGERIQRDLPKSRVVKCFNTVPNALMVEPKLPGGRAEMFICGDDAAAKKAVTAILRELGWSGAIDVGGIDGSRWLEAMVPLWVRVGDAFGTYDHCFQVVRAG